MSPEDSAETRRKIEAALEEAGMSPFPSRVSEQFATYLELLVRWNARLNLTSVREVDQIIRTHFIECAFAALHLPKDIETLLDYGSGAGFPGVPIALCREEIHVVLAESNAKKSSFLHEVLRTTGVRAEVFDARVESLDLGRTFDAVALRAVERMEEAIPVALLRAKKYLALLTTEQSVADFSGVASDLEWFDPIRLPNSLQRVLLIGRRPYAVLQ